MLLFEIGKADANFKDELGQTPLLYATIEGHEAVLQLLLDILSVYSGSSL